MCLKPEISKSGLIGQTPIKDALIHVINKYTYCEHNHWDGWFVDGVEDAADQILELIFIDNKEGN
jgi:N12 class adenine-specific DNA methylase